MFAMCTSRSSLSLAVIPNRFVFDCAWPQNPLTYKLTMVPHANVYIALTQTFDQAAWLLPRLSELSHPTLLRRLRTLAVVAWRSDARRDRVRRPALPGDAVQLG